MMKNLVKVLVVSLVMVLAIAILFSSGVNAAGDSVMLPTSNSTGNTASLPVGNTTTNTANTAGLNTVANTTRNTTTKINDIGSEKDLPQTGENDIYIITMVGVVAVVIGTVAYVKSKKYSM